MHKHPMLQTREDQIAAGRAMALLDQQAPEPDPEFDFGPIELPGEVAQQDELEAQTELAETTPDDEEPDQDEPEAATVPAPTRPLARPLESLAARSSSDVARALRTVDLVADTFSVVPSHRLGQRGEAIGPIPASIAPDSGLLEFILDQLDAPMFEIHFFRPGSRTPYLTAGMTRAQATAGKPAPRQGDTPATPADRLATFMRAMEQRQTQLEDLVTEIARSKAAPPPMPQVTSGDAMMQDFMRECFGMVVGGFKTYLGAMSQHMAKSVQGPPPSGGVSENGLLGKLAALKKLKTEMQECADLFGGGSSEVDDAIKLIGAFTGGGKIDKDEAKRITDEVSAQIDAAEAGGDAE